MAELTIDDRELQGLVRSLERAGKYTGRNKRTLLKKIGTIVHGRAVSYAPRSMTKAEYIATLVHGVTRRATSSFTSGQLKRSITAEYKSDSVHIGVPSNAPAADYAEKVHSEYKRTPHNAPEAQERYIFAAQEDTEDAYMREVTQFVDRIIREV